MRGDGVIERVDRWFLEPAPAERLAVLRVLIGGYGVVWLVARWSELTAHTGFDPDRWDGVGILAPLSTPPGSAVVHLALAGGLAAGVAVVVGWRYRITAPVFALLILGVTTYRNSWAQIFHSENLLALHLLVLAIAPAAAVLSLDARRAPARAEADPRFGWPIRVMALVTVLSYVVAGIAKLRLGDVGWLTGDVLRHQVAFDNVRKVLLGSLSSGPGTWLVNHAGWVFGPFSVFTLAIELGAPIALWRRAAPWWVAAACLFHVGILGLMLIVFPYELCGIAFAPLLPVERLLEPLRRVRARQRKSRDFVAAASGSGSIFSATTLITPSAFSSRPRMSRAGAERAARR